MKPIKYIFKYLCISALVTGCAYWREPPPEPWTGKVFIGDQSQGGMYRSQGKDLVKPDDPRFGDMVCMASADFKALIGSYKFFRAQCEVK